MCIRDSRLPVPRTSAHLPAPDLLISLSQDKSSTQVRSKPVILAKIRASLTSLERSSLKDEQCVRSYRINFRNNLTRAKTVTESCLCLQGDEPCKKEKGDITRVLTILSLATKNFPKHPFSLSYVQMQLVIFVVPVTAKMTLYRLSSEPLIPHLMQF